MKPTLYYPQPGEPCNSCGVCCAHQMCPVALRVLDLPAAAADIPCPFLEWQNDGRGLCGVIAHPEQAVPALCAIYGVDRVRAGAMAILTVGSGCTSEPQRIKSQAQYDTIYERHHAIMQTADYNDGITIFPVHDRFRN